MCYIVLWLQASRRAQQVTLSRPDSRDSTHGLSTWFFDLKEFLKKDEVAMETFALQIFAETLQLFVENNNVFTYEAFTEKSVVCQ